VGAFAPAISDSSDGINAENRMASRQLLHNYEVVAFAPAISGSSDGTNAENKRASRQLLHISTLERRRHDPAETAAA